MKTTILARSLAFVGRFETQSSCFLAAMALGIACSNVRAASALHAVTGSGLVEEDSPLGPIFFRTTVAAHEDADGGVSGAVVLEADLSVLNLGSLKVSSHVDCIHVVGDTAWVASIVSHTSNSDLVPVGTKMITRVRDLGGESEDVMHSDFFPPEVSCTDQPELPDSVVLNGNFHVR